MALERMTITIEVQPQTTHQAHWARIFLENKVRSAVGELNERMPADVLGPINFGAPDSEGQKVEVAKWLSHARVVGTQSTQRPDRPGYDRRIDIQSLDGPYSMPMPKGVHPRYADLMAQDLELEVTLRAPNVPTVSTPSSELQWSDSPGIPEPRPLTAEMFDEVREYVQENSRIQPLELLPHPDLVNTPVLEPLAPLNRAAELGDPVACPHGQYRLVSFESDCPDCSAGR